MPTSIRQLVVTALDTLLKTILVANGYNLGLGSNVFWWRDTPLQVSELPGLVCRDTNDTMVRAIGQHEHALTIEIIALLESSDSGASIRQATADIIKAIGTNVSPNTCLGGYAEDINPPDSEVIEVEHEGIKGYGLKMIFQVIYATSPFDPYTQA